MTQAGMRMHQGLRITTKYFFECSWYDFGRCNDIDYLGVSLAISDKNKQIASGAMQ